MFFPGVCPMEPEEKLNDNSGSVFECDQGHDHHKNIDSVRCCNEVWKTESIPSDECDHPADKIFKIRNPIDGFQCEACLLIMKDPPPFISTGTLDTTNLEEATFRIYEKHLNLVSID